MPTFKIKTVCSKMLFCLTQCICLKKKLKTCLEEEEKKYTQITINSHHPIFDLEKGEL
tara:strand:- start:187 stop:360 length:174 start_codon:yes stop_codon:yes gene_type:complete